MLDLRLAVVGSVWDNNPVKVNCLNPAHHDDTASLAVYPDHLHCYGCGWHRNDADEALSLLLGITQAEAKELAPKFNGKERVEKEEVPLLPLPSSLAMLYHNNLLTERSDRLAWLYSRGLTETGIALGRIGHTGSSFVIPVFDGAGRLLTLRFRRDEQYSGSEGVATGPPKYRGTKGRNGLFLYGMEWLVHDKHSWCVVTEGELDALRLWQDGIPAVSATNGAGQSHRIPLLLRRLLPKYRTLLVATDVDAAGQDASTAVCQAAMQLGFRVIRLSWLESAKDVSEYLAQGGTMKETIKREVCPWNRERWEASATA